MFYMWNKDRQKITNSRVKKTNNTLVKNEKKKYNLPFTKHKICHETTDHDLGVMSGAPEM